MPLALKYIMFYVTNAKPVPNFYLSNKNALCVENITAQRHKHIAGGVCVSYSSIEQGYIQMNITCDYVSTP